MRDWNVRLNSSISRSLVCVNWTCEGLKHPRNFHIPATFTTCELNLWGIETGAKRLIECFHLCVNWTCEGLKLQINSMDKYYTTCVNWTCEGLKLIYVIIVIVWTQRCELNLWGIETRIHLLYNPIHSGVNWTCEGLKQLIAHIAPAAWGVWIEPVRDWNI